MKNQNTIDPEKLRDIKRFWSQLLACHQLAILSIYACEVLELMVKNPAVADIIEKAPGGKPSWTKSAVNNTRLKRYEALTDWLQRMSTSSADAIFDNNGHLAMTLVLLSDTADESWIDKSDPHRLVTWSLMFMSRAVRVVCEIFQNESVESQLTPS